MELIGTVQTIIYRNSSNGWTVLELLDDDAQRIPVVGVLPLVSAGERVRLMGQYTAHPKYGRQFKAEHSESLAPATLSAIEGYLGSGLIKGIGPATAHSIVECFGMDTLEVLDNTPERLLEIPGIGKKRWETIVPSYQENRAMRDILLALEPFGVTVNQAMKLYHIYGNLCMAQVQENPYQLIQDVEGIGFLTADKIAQHIAGFSTESESRIRTGISYVLQQARHEMGHTYLPKELLITYGTRLLGVEERAIDDALDGLISEDQAILQQINGQEAVFLPSLFQMEANIAEKLLRLSEKPIDNPLLRLQVELKQRDIDLSTQQEKAIKLALTEGVLVITGGPGTGKTTIIRYITELMDSIGLEVALTAPTGRAAKRMTEATGHDAKTIHRLLEYIPGEGFLRNRDNPLFFDMIIVDEASMVDVPLMHALLRAIPEGTRLIFVGDSDQLPSVGAGDVLRDMIESQVLSTIRLTEIFRQAQQSMIVTNAHRINAGKMPILDEPQSDFYFEPILSQEQIKQRIVALAVKPQTLIHTCEPLMDIQVLAPMKKGLLGVYSLNQALQGAINPPSPDKKEILSGETLFREGDRILQTKNNYKVEWTKREQGQQIEGAGAFNGDLGTIFRIETENHRVQILFDDDRLAVYDFSQLAELDLAYCLSIHKSQGSEFPVVILPMGGAATPLMTRNLLYTAVTRAKRQVICLGREEILVQMVQNNSTKRRFTALKERLVEWKELNG